MQRSGELATWEGEYTSLVSGETTDNHSEPIFIDIIIIIDFNIYKSVTTRFALPSFI